MYSMFSWSHFADLDGILIIRVKIKLSLIGELSLAERWIILELGSSLLSERTILALGPNAKLCHTFTTVLLFGTSVVTR